MDKNTLIDWAWSAKCKNPITKLVLVTLAQEYDETTGSTPATTEHLGALSELGGSTIRKHITKLEKKGLVKKESRSTNSGATAPNEYIFLTHPVPPQSTRVPPRSIPYNNIYIDTSNLDTSNQLQLLDTSNKLLDRDWLDCLRRDKRWREPATERELEAYIDNCEQSATAMKKEILVEAMDFTDWALARGKSWKTIRGQFPKWIRDELKRPARGNIKQTSTTGSSSHSSDDKYAAAAKRQGGH